MDRLYLGLDVGSSSLKAVLVDDRGTPLGTGSAAYETLQPYPGYVEQNPDDWYTAACDAVRQVLHTTCTAPTQVAGIGLSGTSHVPVMLDADSRVVRPGILWNDLRSDDQVKRLARDAGRLITETTGNSVNCTWSLPQIAWVRENEPDSFKRLRHVLFSKDYLAYRLTASMAADHSSAVSSLLVDTGTLDWDDGLLGMAGIERSFLAPIHQSTAVVGELTTGAAADLGLCPGTPVVIGMLDSAAELIGVGATNTSVALVRLGTAGGVMTLTPRPAWRAGCMLYPHPVRPLWYYQAGTNAATTSLEWALSLFAIDTAGDAYRLLDAEVAGVVPGAEGMLFHPYLRGERAPYWSSHIRGGFSGVTIRHTRPAFLRSVLEGVAYSMRDCTSLLDWDNVTDIRVCGGGAKSGAWCQIIADVLALPVRQVTFQDASALGAALAAVAACTDTDLAQLARDAGVDSRLFEPEHGNVPTYEDGFRMYKEIAQQYLKTFV